MNNDTLMMLLVAAGLFVVVNRKPRKPASVGGRLGVPRVGGSQPQTIKPTSTEPNRAPAPPTLGGGGGFASSGGCGDCAGDCADCAGESEDALPVNEQDNREGSFRTPGFNPSPPTKPHLPNPLPITTKAFIFPGDRPGDALPNTEREEFGGFTEVFSAGPEVY